MSNLQVFSYVVTPEPIVLQHTTFTSDGTAFQYSISHCKQSLQTAHRSNSVDSYITTALTFCSFLCYPKTCFCKLFLKTNIDTRN